MKVKVGKFLKNPIDIYEGYQQRKLSKEAFLIVISCSICVHGFVHGYIIAQSQLLLTNQQFLTLMNTNYAAFSQKFISVFYLGEMFGSLCSFPFMDEFGRRNTLLCAGILCACNLIWCAVTFSASSLLSSRFFIGVCLGGMMNCSAVYIAEVSQLCPTANY
jgi:MFS family permease